MAKKSRTDHIREASQAHVELVLFATVVSILESGNIKSGSHAAAQRVIEICQRQQQVLLIRHDNAVAAANQ